MQTPPQTHRHTHTPQWNSRLDPKSTWHCTAQWTSLQFWHKKTAVLGPARTVGNKFFLCIQGSRCMNSKLWIHTHAPLYHSLWSLAQGAGCCSPTANQPCLELSCFHLNGCKVGRWWGYRQTPSDYLKKQTHYIVLFWVQHFGKHSYSRDANQGLWSESPVNYQPTTRTFSLPTQGMLQDVTLHGNLQRHRQRCSVWCVGSENGLLYAKINITFMSLL